MKKKHGSRRLFTLLLAIAVCLACVPEALAEDASAATMRLTKTEGTVAISDSSGQSVSVREKLRLYSGYSVKTEAESYAWFNLDSEKLLKEDAVSQVSVRKSGKKLEVLLDSGNLFFNVQEPLKSDEALHIRTSTMGVGIRGTCGWVKVIDQWQSQLYILEGTVAVTVADPVTGQTKTETVTGGETVTCVVYPQDKAGDKCDILRGRYSKQEIDGFVLVNVVPDGGLCDKIYEDSGLDLRDGSIDAQKRLEEDQDRVGAELADIQKRLAGQDTGISMTPVWTNPVADKDAPPAAVLSDPQNSSGSGGEDSSPSDSGSSEEPSDVVTLTMPVTAAEVNDYLGRNNVRQVILRSPGATPASAVAMPYAAGYPGRGALRQAAVQAMAVQAGSMSRAAEALGSRLGRSLLQPAALQPMAARASTTDLLEVDCTLTVPSRKTLTLQPYVSMQVLEGQTLSVAGTLSVGGAFTGTLTPTKGASIRAKHFTLTSPVKDWAVSKSADSEGYYSLVYAPQEEGKVTWRYDEATKTLYIEGSGPMEDYAGPSDIPWKAYQTEMRSLVIAEGITRIGDDAFYECSGLTGPLTIPDSVISIGSWAFYGCSGLTGPLMIPDGVQSIDSFAFYGCSGLTGSLTIPDSVASMGKTAFWGCSGLTGSLVMSAGIQNIGEATFVRCSGLDNVTIPSGVQSIGRYVFEACSGLTSVTISDSVTSIEEGAFYGCNSLTDVYYGGTREQWGSISIDADSNAPLLSANIHFAGETGNVTWRYDETTKTLYIEGSGPMQDYGLAGETTRAPWGVYSSDMRSLVIADGITSIGSHAFYNCTGLTGPLTIPDSVTAIYDSAFSGCSGFTGPLTIPDGVTVIDDFAFSDCSGFTGPLTVPNGVQSIGGHAFNNCSGLSDVTIPDSVQSIEDHAFYGCLGLNKVTISTGVTSIGEWAFGSCGNLKDVYYGGTATQWSAISIGSGNDYLLSATIHFAGEPEGVTWRYDEATKTLHIEGNGPMEDYVTDGSDATTAPWAAYATEMQSLVIADGITSIGDYAFHNCSGLTGPLTIPSRVQSIGNSAFHNCSGLTGPLTIPDSVQSIGRYAFYNCSGLTGSLTIPNNVQSIGNSAFSGCSGFTGPLKIPDKVTSIGSAAFFGCSGLTDVTIPNGVTSIETSTFFGCSGLTDVTIPNSVTSIGNLAFYGCHGLTDVTIPDSVTSIDSSAFKSCHGLTDVTIPGSVKSIGNQAFYDCTSLANVYYSGTEEQWNAIDGVSTANIFAIIHYNGTRSRVRKAPADAAPGANGLVPGYSVSDGDTPDADKNEDNSLLGVSVPLADAPAAWPFPSFQNAAMAFQAPAVRRLSARTTIPAAIANLARSMTASAPASGTLSVFSAMDVMCSPNGIAAGPDGKLLVTDTYHKQVWQVQDRFSQNYAGGETVQDLYGQPLGGYHDSSLAASYFKEPWAIAPFLDGWAVSDRENNAVRLITGSSIQTLNPVTGSKERVSVSNLGFTFNAPTGLAADADGNLYIAETRSGVIRRVTPEGGMSTVAKGLSEPMGLCWKDGALYIAETGKNRILVLKNNKLTTAAGKGTAGYKDGSAKSAAFNAPQGVAVGPDGSIYVADTGNSAVRKIQNGSVRTLAARDFGELECGMISPTGLLVQGDRLFICDRFSRKIFIYQ